MILLPSVQRPPKKGKHLGWVHQQRNQSAIAGYQLLIYAAICNRVAVYLAMFIGIRFLNLFIGALLSAVYAFAAIGSVRAEAIISPPPVSELAPLAVGQFLPTDAGAVSPELTVDRSGDLLLIEESVGARQSLPILARAQETRHTLAAQHSARPTSQGETPPSLAEAIREAMRPAYEELVDLGVFDVLHQLKVELGLDETATFKQFDARELERGYGPQGELNRVQWESQEGQRAIALASRTVRQIEEDRIEAEIMLAALIRDLKQALWVALGLAALFYSVKFILAYRRYKLAPQPHRGPSQNGYQRRRIRVRVRRHQNLEPVGARKSENSSPSADAETTAPG